MRNLLFVSLIFLLGTAASASLIPNHYVCEGKNLRVVYSATGVDGQRSLTMDGIGNSFVPSFVSVRGEEVRVEQTIFGEVVSGFLGAIADLKTEYGSLVIPLIHLRASTDAVEFVTQFVTTTKMTTIGGPEFSVGLIDRSSVSPVKCKATLVYF